MLILSMGKSIRMKRFKLFQKVNEFVIKRFYLTLMLYELWKQKTIWEVAEKFQQPRGFIQNLLSSAASFASCVAHFCQVNITLNEHESISLRNSIFYLQLYWPGRVISVLITYASNKRQC